ncbi:PREDICTED: zinc finger protein 239-like [Pterocles gutturalis]|uniref:zinc finger protein 239-like n=1 Tax=Pterocles gutturalis TaxID=240206 RepID=UPI0005284BB1|nr:PREDICTED: zinc finger protein 239-like [Pterocles gutturalis]
MVFDCGVLYSCILYDDFAVLSKQWHILKACLFPSFVFAVELLAGVCLCVLSSPHYVGCPVPPLSTTLLLSPGRANGGSGDSTGGAGRRLAVAGEVERPYGCEQCGKAFVQAGALEKPYRCPVCAKASALSSGLVLHKRTHTGERPHACLLCGKAFVFSSHLALHICLHTGERPYKCEKCGKNFLSSAHLVSHTSFWREELRVLHLQAFSRSSCLQLHVRTHSGERLYHCLLCNRTYAKISTFEKHCKKHQQDEERPDARPRPMSTRAKALVEEKKKEQKQHHRDDSLEQPPQADPKQQQQQVERL